MTQPYDDPIGRAVFDYHFHQINQPVIVHSDDFDDDVIETSYLFRSFRQMPPLEKKALQLCRGTVLDVGACAGAHTLYLQNKGFEVSAIETSGLCCQVLTDLGVKEVINQDIFEYSGKTFDTILLLMNGTGIAGNLLGLDNLFKHLKTLLNPEGQILIDSSDLIFLYEDEDGSALIDLNAETYYGELTFQTEYRTWKGKPFPWLYVDKETFQMLAEKNGFKINAFFDGTHYDYLAQLTFSNGKTN